VLSAKDLWSFEEEVAEAFAAGKIKGPVHLNSPSQIPHLLKIFEQVKPEDWVLGSWRAHYHALLKGVPREWVMHAVMNGRSMMLHFPSRRFLTSAIVGGTLPIACGLASAGARVWCFVGDMTATTGLYHEATKLAATRGLPITFIKEDNGLSTNSPTKAAWGLHQDHVEELSYTYQRHGSHYLPLPGARGF